MTEAEGAVSEKTLNSGTEDGGAKSQGMQQSPEPGPGNDRILP